MNKKLEKELKERENLGRREKKYTSSVLFTPGFFIWLYTFGRDLKWNPHIHVLIFKMKLDSVSKAFFAHKSKLALPLSNVLLIKKIR